MRRLTAVVVLVLATACGGGGGGGDGGSWTIQGDLDGHLYQYGTPGTAELKILGGDTLVVILTNPGTPGALVALATPTGKRSAVIIGVSQDADGSIATTNDETLAILGGARTLTFSDDGTTLHLSFTATAFPGAPAVLFDIVGTLDAVLG